MPRSIVLGAFVLALTVLRVPFAFGGCDDPAALCMERCNAAYHVEQLCIDKCQQKVACNSTFDLDRCNLKCIGKCTATKAKLLTKSCDCSAYPATRC